MQKATLLTLALSVSALFASAQSLKTFTAGKVYSIKNKNHSAYAAAMPQTSDMACSSTLNLACLFTITPVEGSEGVYTIKPYADNTKVVYSIKVANDNNTVGIKASDDADNTKWKIAATDATNTNYVTITSSTKPTATDGYWNHRGTNADWNLVGIGGYTAKSVADNPGSYWTIAEVSNEEIETAKTNFANIYSTILAGKIGEQVGYYSKLRLTKFRVISLTQQIIRLLIMLQNLLPSLSTCPLMVRCTKFVVFTMELKKFMQAPNQVKQLSTT